MTVGRLGHLLAIGTGERVYPFMLIHFDYIKSWPASASLKMIISRSCLLSAHSFSQSQIVVSSRNGFDKISKVIEELPLV